MKSAIKYALRRLICFLRDAAVVLLVLAVVGFLGPDFEGRFFPVASDFRLLETRIEPNGNLAIKFEAYRNRDCDRLSSAWFRLDKDGRWVYVPGIHVVGDLPANRPTGPQISPWNVVGPPGTYLLRVRNGCHSLWTTPVSMGPFVVEAP